MQHRHEEVRRILYRPKRLITNNDEGNSLMPGRGDVDHYNCIEFDPY